MIQDLPGPQLLPIGRKRRSYNTRKREIAGKNAPYVHE